MVLKDNSPSTDNMWNPSPKLYEASKDLIGALLTFALLSAREAPARFIISVGVMFSPINRPYQLSINFHCQRR